MKPGKTHIILLIFLIMAGCSREDRHNENGNETVKKPVTVFERFTDIPEEPIINNNSVEHSEDEAPYFVPMAQLRKQKQVFNNQIINTKEGKPSPVQLMHNPLSSGQSPVFFKHGVVSDMIAFSLIVDNDIIDYTDYYYTSGLTLEFFHPAIAFSPFSVILPGLKQSLNYYSLSLTQNIYTPVYLDMYAIQPDDRPFAAYLTLGHRKTSLVPRNKQRLETEFSMGVIGPASLGGIAQTVIHEDKPLGWENQLQNDMVVNYNIRYERGVYGNSNMDLSFFAGGQAGTLYDNVKGGISFQAGNTAGRFESLFLSANPLKQTKTALKYFIALDLENKFVIYDATMQGGMLNRDNVHTLPPGRINRYLFTGKASVGIGWKRYTLEAEQVFLTPEFKGGRRHMWFRIRNVVTL